MKIAIVLPVLDGGGAERGAVGWGVGLAANGHDVTLLTHRGAGGTPPPGVKRVHLPQQDGPRYWVGLVRWLRTMQAREQFDVVLGVLELSNLAVLAAFPKPGPQAPIVLASEHNVNSIFLPTQGKGGRAKLALARRLYRRADGVIALSHAVATDLVVRFGVPQDRLYVVPLPLSNWDSPHHAGPAPHLRVAFAGRLTAQKRPERVLHVVEELSRRGHDASAIFIGDGSLRSQLEQQAQLLSAPVEFAGWVPDWRERAVDATCLLMTSDYEGLGLVLLEAAGMGLPSVAPSSALAVADAMIIGVTGVLSLSTGVAHLADAVLEAADLPRGQVERRWLEMFGPDRTAAQLERVCESALSRRFAA